MSSPTPLLSIERNVQSAARSEGVDISLAQNRERLRTLISGAIDEWQSANPARPLTSEARRYLAQRAEADVAGYGPLQALLEDDSVWEIIVNSPEAIFVKRHGRPTAFHGAAFHDADHLRRTVERILADSGLGQRALDPAEGLQDAQLRGGARLHIVHADLTREGSLALNIRKFTGLPRRSLDDLVEGGMLSQAAASLLRAAQSANASIVFSGPPGSGKTTLLSALAAEMPADTRVVVAEEVLETHIPLPNVAHLQTRPARPERPAVDLRRLVAGFLRMAPDLAIVGEVRDHEALPLVLTLSSGVSGYTTLHATSARAALSRLRLLVQIAGHSIPFPAATQMVTDAVDLVVHCTRLEGRPAVTEIHAVEDSAAGADSTTFTTTPLFMHSPSGLLPSGLVPARLGERARSRGDAEFRRRLQGLESHDA